MEISAILALLEVSLSIWKNKEATKYQRKVYKLKKERNIIQDGELEKETGKIWVDRNELDRINRDILLLSSLVTSEISRS